MGVKYVKDFSFPTTGGFHGDVQRYAKGGHVTKVPAKAKASVKDVPARAKPNAPAKGAPKMKSAPAKGKRQGYNEGGRVPGYEMDRLPTKRPPGRGMDLAPARRFKGDYQGYAEGGPVDEILPGDGRGGLEMAMPTKQVKRYSDEYDLPPLLPEEPSFPRPELEQTPIRLREDLYPIGDLMPLPEEPLGRKTSGPPPPPGMKVNPNYGKPGQDYYVFIDDAARQEFMPMRPIMQEPAPRTRADMIADRRDIVGSRGEMARPRGLGRAVMRARDKIAARAPTPRMGIPKMPEISPFDPSVRAGYGDREIPVFKKGGEVKGKKIAKVMGEYKRGELRSGSKKGPKVTNPKQAMAIALSEAGAKKKAMGGIFNDEDMAYESKGPKTRYSAAKGRRMSKERAMERRALDKARHAEKYAPGMSLDMADKKSKGGMPVHRRKPMYGGGKC